MTRARPALALLLAVGLGIPGLRAEGGNAYLAASFFRQKKYEKVLKILEGMEDPGPRLMLFKGDSLAGLDRRPEAIAAYKELIAKYPEHPDAFEARRKVMMALDQDKSYPALIDEIRAYRASDPQGRLPYTRMEADALFKAGRYDEAIKLLEASDEASDQRSLADLLRELDRTDAYLKAAALPAGDFKALRRRGILLTELRRAPDAIAALAAASALDPGDVSCLERRAELLEGEHRVDEAVDLYRKLVELRPEEVKLASRLGSLLWSAGKQEEARRIWKRLVDHAPGDLQRAKLVARLFLEHQDPDRALEIVAAVREETTRVDLLTDEAESAYLMRKDPEAAASVWLPLLLRPVPQGSGEQSPRERFLDLAHRGPQYAEAASRALAKALLAAPAEFELVQLADELAREQGAAAEVTALIGRLVAAVGDDPARLRDMGERFHDQDRPQEASLLLLAALERVPGPQGCMIALDAAEQLHRLGEHARAQALVAPCLADGGAPGVQLRAADLLGKILLDGLRKPVEARRHYTEWIPRLPRQSPYGVPWVVMAARAAADAGDFGAAEAAYQALLKRPGANPAVPEVEYRLGMLALYAGKLEDARARLRKLCAEHPDSPYANDALREVAFLLDRKEAGDKALGRYLAVRHLVDSGRYDDYRKAVAKAPEADATSPLLDADYMWLEASVLAATGPAKDRVAVLEAGAQAARQGPRGADFLWALAEAYEAAGAVDKAKDAYRRFLAEQGESLRLDEGRSRLRSLEHRTP